VRSLVRTTLGSIAAFGALAASAQPSWAEEVAPPPPAADPPSAAPPAGAPEESAPPENEPDDDEDEVYEAVAEVAAPPRQATQRSLDARALTTVPGTAGDPLKAIEVLPGVGRSSEGDPILRGAAQHESAVFIDGTSVPFLYHFGNLRSVVHPRLVESVDVYPGNFSVRYGRATGGIVAARMRDPRRDGLHGEIELSLLDSSALIEGPVASNLSFEAAARRSNIDFVFENFVPDDTFDVVVAPVYWDYQGALVYTPGGDSRLRLSFIGSKDATTLSFGDPNAENPALRGEVGGSIEFHRVQLAYLDRYGDLRQELQAYVGQQHLEQNVGPNSQTYFDVTDFGGRAEWELPVCPELTLIAGLDVQGSAFEGAYRGSAAPSAEGSLGTPDNVEDQITVDRTTFLLFNPAAYVEARVLPTSRLLLLPGIRFDYYHQNDAGTVNPRLSQRYELSDALTLKSAVGWFSQPPLYYEAIAGVGNPLIQPYHALHVSAGGEVRVSDALSFDVEGFYKRLTSRIVSTPGSAPPHFVNDGQGRVIGLELGAKYTASSGLAAQVAYTLSRSERQDRDEGWRLFDQDQTHVLSIALGYPLGAGWHAGARFRYVTGNPVTPVIGSFYDAATDVYYPIFGAHNGERDPAFQELDLRIEKTFAIGRGRLSAYLDVQNVYAAENAQGFTYSYDYREREATTGAPFFPNLGLRGEL
jgi:outer membrane receptor protein involved in Fe transport